MRWTAQGTHEATTVFEAACFSHSIKPVCRCGHHTSFEPHGLWWLFHKRHWDDRLTAARRRFWCRVCKATHKRKVYAVRIELVKPSSADFSLPLPDDREWKRAVSRFRA